MYVHLVLYNTNRTIVQLYWNSIIWQIDYGHVGDEFH
jgi:hypothetical protein